MCKAVRIGKARGKSLHKSPFLKIGHLVTIRWDTRAPNQQNWPPCSSPCEAGCPEASYLVHRSFTHPLFID